MQVTPVQLQRLWRLFRYQEWIEEDDNKVFFHLTRDCASVSVDDVIFSGKTKKNQKQNKSERLVNYFHAWLLCSGSSNIYH